MPWRHETSPTGASSSAQGSGGAAPASSSGAEHRPDRGRRTPVGTTPVHMDRRQRQQRSRSRPPTGGERGATGRSRTGAAFASPFAHALRTHRADRTPAGGGARRRSGSRPLCGRCGKQRPGERIRCLSCDRRVGPGCKPGCLLMETDRASRERLGLCADWPQCGASTPGAWTEVVRGFLARRTTGTGDPVETSVRSTDSRVFPCSGSSSFSSSLSGRWSARTSSQKSSPTPSPTPGSSSLLGSLLETSAAAG